MLRATVAAAPRRTLEPGSGLAAALAAGLGSAFFGADWDAGYFAAGAAALAAGAAGSFAAGAAGFCAAGSGAAGAFDAGAGVAGGGAVLFPGLVPGGWSARNADQLASTAGGSCL